MADLAGFYERVATLVGRPAPHEVVLPASVPALAGLDGNRGRDGNSGTVLPSGEADRGKLVRVITAPHPYLLWVEECLRHLSSHAQAITGRPCLWPGSAACPGGARPVLARGPFSRSARHRCALQDAPFFLCGAAPDAGNLSEVQRPAQARCRHRAALANVLGRLDVGQGRT
jgi:hypothetical protein